MTKEEILAMQAGIELDILILENVLEYQRETRIEPSKVYEQITGRNYCWRKETSVFQRPPPYSTDISAALQVMEKDGAWDIKKRFRPHPDDPAGTGGRATYQAKCFLSDYDPYEDELINKRTGKSPWCWGLPEAICKAALLIKYSPKNTRRGVKMREQCQNCGRFVPIGKGITTVIKVSKEMVKRGRPEEIYLCDQEKCAGKLELFKTFEWYAGHEIA